MTEKDLRTTTSPVKFGMELLFERTRITALLPAPHRGRLVRRHAGDPARTGHPSVSDPTAAPAKDMPFCIVRAGPDGVVRCRACVLYFGALWVPSSRLARPVTPQSLGGRGRPTESVGRPGAGANVSSGGSGAVGGPGWGTQCASSGREARSRGGVLHDRNARCGELVPSRIRMRTGGYDGRRRTIGA
jgi:hypothetical protein